MNSVLIESSGAGEPDLENRVLRQAVQENLASFPSQVPAFAKQARPDLQQKLALLYFVRGWTMDDLAKRYGLGRQRVGQILSAWRTSALKEGYIQAIEPAHPLFQRVRMDEPKQSSEVQAPSSGSVVQILRTDPPPHNQELHEPRAAIARGTEHTGLSLAEQLETLIGILDNQLLLRSKPLYGSVDSCEPLLARAETLCALLEVHVAARRTNDGEQARAVISAARELFQSFQERAAIHAGK